MAIKCMRLDQALTSQGMKFSSFNFSTVTGFSFSLDIKESGQPAFAVAEQVKKKKRKLSLSDVRRNQRRRQEFLKSKSKGRKDESSVVLQTPERSMLHIRLLIFSLGLPLHPCISRGMKRTLCHPLCHHLLLPCLWSAILSSMAACGMILVERLSAVKMN